MATYRFHVDAVIPDRAEKLYAILADYRVGHQAVLPRPPFITMVVEEGGVGAGTVTTTSMRLLGRVQTFRSLIDEPEPGRLLRETIPASGMVTTFGFEPLASGAQCRVTIATEIPVIGGPIGKAFGAFIARLLRDTYRRELELVRNVAAGG